MPNGNLENWLYSQNNYLDVLQRINIMIDVASALEYLHHGLTTTIVHSDLKPSNVLLDEDMVAHVCDFGISQLLGEEEHMTRTSTLGTIGYMAPGNTLLFTLENLKFGFVLFRELLVFLVGFLTSNGVMASISNKQKLKTMTYMQNTRSYTFFSTRIFSKTIPWKSHIGAKY